MAEALAALGRIRVEPEVRSGYRREDWPHWLDTDGNCLNVREEVLVAESTEPARLSADRCSVLAGRWVDPYTGEILTDPRTVDIDHVVALQEAHDSGGHGWPRERRAAFANDLSDPRTLVATSAAANRAKGAKDPAEWLPPDPAALCGYVAEWVVIKARWQLAMNEAERIAVGNILTDCDARLAAAP
ncbi:HNH endonuclease family protein [Arenibaculum pallidiluteum]|uniref:HNH endonuclease family protein n=1 Tax=Arenibaculum pallidiluteum TaxID=2812559 RepID=UPI001B3BACDE|nr:HNH endonuclease family protein [Arenibaculum pallidiluteum]